MFRFVLTQAKNPKFSSIFRAKVSAHHRILREHNSGGGIFGRLFPREISTNALIIVHSSFCRNYATIGTINSDKLTQTELDDVIDKLNKRNDGNGIQLSQYELKVLFNRIKLQTPTAEQALKILKLCSADHTDSNVTEIVKSIWHELHSVDAVNAHEFDTQHYNCVLKFASDRRDVNYTQAIFDQMIADGNAPNATSYEHLLSVYCKSGNMEKTKEILNMMDQNQLPLSECSYNYMIQCYIISGTVTDAHEMIKSICNGKPDERKFKINRDTLATVLHHYANLSDLENCGKTLAIFKTLNHVELLNHDIFNVMLQFCINGHADRCDSLFQYFEPNAEMQIALRQATTSFVQNHQSRHFVEIFERLIFDGLDSGDKSATYSHLIHEMCRCNTPANELEATIELIESNGHTMEKNFDSFKSALKSSSPTLIRRVLLHMKANGMQVSEMAFEKLFELTAALKEADVLNVINAMCVDFKIQPNFVYIRDVILPAILNTIGDPNAENAVTVAADKLLNTKIRHHRTLNALINYSLNRCDFKTTIHLLNVQEFFYAKKFITEALLNSYASTGDARNFVEILRLICRNFSKITDYHPKELSNAEIKQKKRAFIGEMLTAAVGHSMADESRFAKLLTELAAANDELAIDANLILKIQQQITESVDLNQRAKEQHMLQINCLLKSLPTTAKDRSNSTLDLLRRQQHQPLNASEEQLNAAEIKINLHAQHALGRDVTGIEKLLFFAYVRDENIPEVEAMLSGKTTLTGELNLNNANYAMLIKMYVRHKDLEKAMNMLERARRKDSTFTLHPMLLAQLIILMYEVQGRFNINEIRALLHMHRQVKMKTSRNIPFELLLQRLATDGRTQDVQQLFDTLVQFHYIQATLETAGPLVTVHLNKGEYDLAVQKYHELGNAYKFFPMSGTLFKALIESQQSDLLKRAVDILTNGMGKSAAMSQLAFAYCACGQIQQAKEIFQSAQISDLTKDIGKASMRYARRDDLEAAKCLLKSTEGILTCDRRPIYQTILDYYSKYDMAEAALELWSTISTDDILPTPQFIDKLAKLLQTNHIDLPYDLQNKIKRRN